MANVSVKGIDIQNNNLVLYIKDGKDFYTAKNIGLQVCKHDGNVQLKYLVEGRAHDCLYLKDENGLMRKADCSYTYQVKVRVVCDRSGREEIFDFMPTEDGKMVFHGWVANGTLERKTYELQDGDYDGEIRYNNWAVLDLGLKAEEVGFRHDVSAKFFNSYSIDHEPHESLVDKICPAKDKQKIGLTVIHNLFTILKMNGLKLVYSDEDNSLGIINDVEVDGGDLSDDEAVPHWNVVTLFTDEHPTYVSEAWSFAMKK